MSNIFFTSDTHLGHINICRGTSHWNDRTRCRDFETVEEMNEKLINGINAIVGPDDILYHLGDFAFGNSKSINEYINRIECKNIILILGNHDMRFKKLYKERLKDVVDKPPLVWKPVDTHNVFYMRHYPFNRDNIETHFLTCPLLLHGHTHCYNGRIHDGQIDVSVEGNDYKPYHIDEIIKLHKEYIT